MKRRHGATLALLFLATCSEDPSERSSLSPEQSRKALGTVPPTEIAVWRKVGAGSTPDGRYLQSVAFDEARRVLVMFGGINSNPSTGTVAPNQETWEWSAVTGKWTNRTGTGVAPNPRSGAAMVYDSARGKIVLFGGRAASGSNFEDTWEWDPTTGAWTSTTAAGSHPSARAQHAMVYEKSTGKVLLFGGGRSSLDSFDGTGISVSMGDTWAYDPATYAWTTLAPASSPSVRHDAGMVWDSSRNKAVLFGGLQTDIAGAPGVPKQDTWEWDPETSTWTERTTVGNKPSQRYAHAMAFDGSRKQAVLFGGWDISTGVGLNDLWDWEPLTGVWTRRLSGSESGVPAPRMYASMVSDDAGARLELIAGVAAYNPYGTGGVFGSGGSVGGGPVPVPIPVPGWGYGTSGSREIWELDPATAAFTDRTAPLDVPTARYSQAMAYNPTTGKTYLFGGYDAMTGQILDDLWAWDGKAWALVPTATKPPARTEAALAYDPARKSLILFGGNDNFTGLPYGDTWELTGAGQWTKLAPLASPEGLFGHGMVSDTTRSKILLFGGMAGYVWLDGPYKDPMRNEVWEWDGVALTWTNRTPPASVSSPMGRIYPFMAYDSGRQKLFLYDGTSYSGSATGYWEWDPIAAGWTSKSTSDPLGYAQAVALTYDSLRRRTVLLTDPYSSPAATQQTWEVDGNGPTWYVRSLATSPGGMYGASMVFDSARGVAVLFGGQTATKVSSETWEYSVTNLGNGEGCTAASAATCASGNCVDGVCCDVAACTGPCQSCSVPGSEGTCVLAKAGTEVPGSCAQGQSCDGTGACKTKNGQPCTAATTCASGFCADGVCCDRACTGACASCALAGQAGKCTPYPAGTDPQAECGLGTGVCKSTCDGVGACAYPQANVPCATCYTCDGMGTCSSYDYYCGSYGGSIGGTGGRPFPTGGTGGYIPSVGGAGGLGRGGAGGSGGRVTGVGGGIPNVGGAAGGIPNLGGGAGSIPNLGGSAGNIGARDAGSIPGLGGGIPNLGGSAGNIGARDAGSIPGFGGAIGRDGGVGDGGGTKLGKSGCSCDVGAGRSGQAGVTAPFVLFGAALLLGRPRWRRRR